MKEPPMTILTDEQRRMSLLYMQPITLQNIADMAARNLCLNEGLAAVTLVIQSQDGTTRIGGYCHGTDNTERATRHAMNMFRHGTETCEGWVLQAEEAKGHA